VALCMCCCAYVAVHVLLCMCCCACVAVHVLLCMWRCACVAVHVLLCMWRCACGAVHVALCMWRCACDSKGAASTLWEHPWTQQRPLRTHSRQTSADVAVRIQCMHAARTGAYRKAILRALLPAIMRALPCHILHDVSLP
jgi:hypothetical protein